jgi:acetyl-CoA carboxylase biotin carboxyl carrier protein
MPFQHIDQIVAYLRGTGITSLELSGPSGAIRLVNGGDDQVGGAASPAAIMVTSPGTGRFLHRHPQRQEALVAAGARVDAGAIIGLLRVGVLLIPIPAPRAGQVTGHLVADGDIVGFGTNVFALHPLAPRTAP